MVTALGISMKELNCIYDEQYGLSFSSILGKGTTVNVF